MLDRSNPDELDELRMEVFRDYYKALRVAVSNYCLMDDRTRERLAVMVYPEVTNVSPWGDERYMTLPSLNVAIAESFGFLQPENP